MERLDILRRPDIFQAQVAQHLHSQYGDVDLEPLYEGVESVAYRFESEQGPQVVRVSQDAVGFTKDRSAYERFTMPHLPLAKVDSITSYEKYAMCISQALPGTAIDEAVPIIAGVSDVPNVWQLLLDIQAQDIRATRGYGEWGESGDAPFGTWRDYLLSTLDGVDELAQRGGIDPASLDEIVSAYRELVGYCPDDRVLVHGDFLGGNVLVNDRQVSGLIDWKYSMYGDPLYDIGGSSFIGTTASEVLVDTAKRTHEYDNVQERLTCYRLHVGLRNIRMGVHTHRTNWARVALQASLNHVRSHRLQA